MPRLQKKSVVYDHWGYLFVAPFVVAYAFYSLYPIILTLALGFTDATALSRSANFVGLAKFKGVLAPQFFTGSFWHAFRNTWLMWTLAFVPQIAVAFLVAIWFSDRRMRLPGKGFFKTVFYLPNLIPAVSVALLFRAFLAYPNGPVNQLLRDQGLNEGVVRLLRWAESALAGGSMGNDASGSVNFARSAVFNEVLVSFLLWWNSFGKSLIFLGAGISGIPLSFYESARVDGANSRQVFWRITLPCMRPVLSYVFVTSLIDGLQMFDLPYVLSNGSVGGPKSSILSMSTFIYYRSFQGPGDISSGAAGATVVFFIVALLCLLLFWTMRDPGSAKPPKASGESNRGSRA
jgi:multiple sugar transport system permease protein